MTEAHLVRNITIAFGENTETQETKILVRLDDRMVIPFSPEEAIEISQVLRGMATELLAEQTGLGGQPGAKPNGDGHDNSHDDAT